MDIEQTISKVYERLGSSKENADAFSSRYLSVFCNILREFGSECPDAIASPVLIAGTFFVHLIALEHHHAQTDTERERMDEWLSSYRETVLIYLDASNNFKLTKVDEILVKDLLLGINGHVAESTILSGVLELLSLSS